MKIVKPRAECYRVDSLYDIPDDSLTVARRSAKNNRLFCVKCWNEIPMFVPPGSKSVSNVVCPGCSRFVVNILQYKRCG